MKNNALFLKEVRGHLSSATNITTGDDCLTDYQMLRAAASQAQQAANTLFELLGIVQNQQDTAKGNN